MPRFNEMNPRQKRIYRACENGWYMGGKYRAVFDNHERTFFADSKPTLFRDVERWYDAHKVNHSDARLLVKCVQAL